MDQRKKEKLITGKTAREKSGDVGLRKSPKTHPGVSSVELVRNQGAAVASREDILAGG